MQSVTILNPNRVPTTYVIKELKSKRKTREKFISYVQFCIFLHLYPQHCLNNPCVYTTDSVMYLFQWKKKIDNQNIFVLLKIPLRYTGGVHISIQEEMKKKTFNLVWRGFHVYHHTNIMDLSSIPLCVS